MNRIDRLTAILIQLQSKRVVKAQEIADRFGMSLRTVYRDIRALEEAGVPIGAEAGVGYFLEDYHLPPVMFTNEEASALLFGAKLIGKMADESLREGFDSAFYKIKSVLKRNEKEHLEDLESRVEVLARQRAEPFSVNSLNVIQQAIVRQQVLGIDYVTNFHSHSTQREIEPIGLVHYSSHWHLIAYCRLRGDYRDFRVDRIQNLTNTEVFFPKQNLLTLQAYLDRLRVEEQLEEVTIWVHKGAAMFMQEQRYTWGFLSEEVHDKYVKMTFMTQFFEGMGRWLLTFGKHVSVESPLKMKDMMHTLALEIQEHYLS
ncbi:helix-turn-helix transcriptional regulator [Runella salmonicolor]|uniref:YafY family transcriptional regulator n=1 Tax=Runella salmonicolor TaxID=2950278 RepID=A0ABT1FKN1_9BACT|nr:YafY family protein [Runella salmonicolor]MCP1381343.1 YafY family transcriptional regulator [Runella salmonicolor]